MRGGPRVIGHIATFVRRRRFFFFDESQAEKKPAPEIKGGVGMKTMFAGEHTHTHTHTSPTPGSKRGRRQA